MQPDGMGADGAHPNRIGFNTVRQSQIAALLVLLGFVWAFARFGDDTASEPATPSQPVIGAFVTPQKFLANPGHPYTRINIRSGPSAKFKVREQVSRDVELIGVARATDNAGAYWIELADHRGFAKETVLVPSHGGS